MSELLAEGYYSGRILNYGVRPTKKGDPAPTVVFGVKVDGDKEVKIYWQGSFNGGGLDITLGALAVMGLDNPSRLRDLPSGVDGGALDLSKEYSLTVECEHNQESGKSYNKVKWVNPISGGSLKDAMSVAEFGSFVTGLNLESHFVRLAAEKGFKLNSGAPRPSASEPSAPIPF